jgi:hypothetical protein
MSCSFYVASRMLCLFSAHFLRCAKYVCKRVYYDGNFSIKDFDYLTIKR